MEFKDHVIQPFHLTEEEESKALRFAHISPGVKSGLEPGSADPQPGSFSSVVQVLRA